VLLCGRIGEPMYRMDPHIYVHTHMYMYIGRQKECEFIYQYNLVSKLFGNLRNGVRFLEGIVFKENCLLGYNAV
jgi:hypothetical protein